MSVEFKESSCERDSSKLLWIIKAVGSEQLFDFCESPLSDATAVSQSEFGSPNSTSFFLNTTLNFFGLNSF